MIDVASIVIVVTGLVAIVTLLQNYKKNRNEIIINYYEKTQELRELTDSLSLSDKGKNRDKAESVFSRTLNFYNLMSYAILRGIVNEKDAFFVLKSNIDSFAKVCDKRKIDSFKRDYLTRLDSRWSTWGISLYYLKQFSTWLVVLIILFVAIWIILFVNPSLGN